MNGVSRWSPLLTTSALAMSLALFGCGDDEDDGGADTGSSQQDTGGTSGADSGGTTDDAGGSGEVLPTHEAATYRLTTVDIIRPPGIGEALQGLINADIGNDVLHVIIDMKDFSATDGRADFTLTGNAGSYVDGSTDTFTWFADAEVTDDDYKPAFMESDGYFENTENLSIIFPALATPGDPTDILPIPVSELAITGNLFDDGSGAILMSAQLSGVIFEDEVEDILVSSLNPNDPRPLPDLLGRDNAEEFPAYDNRRGWTLEAEIEAARVPFEP